MTQKGGWPRFETKIRYAEHSALNTYQVCLLRPDDDAVARLWVVYVHGGAWYDANQDATTFDRAQDLLLRSSIVEQIAGFASIDYRLSPPPPDSSLKPDPSDPARNAKHPEHIQDVLAALGHLQHAHPSAHRYILVGHSCGATLAMQVAMNQRWDTDSSSPDATPPLAICGIEGLYDLPALVRHNAQHAIYRDFVTNAFGPEEDAWRRVSPAFGDYNKSWKAGRLVVVAHSRQDELVEWEQPELILASLRRQGFHASSQRKVLLLELSGTHDSVWSEGSQVAKAIEKTLIELMH